MEEHDLSRYMEEAFRLAKEALDAHEVPIGCVIVDLQSGTILASGRNRTNEGRDATRHAELEALSALKPEERPLLAHSALLVTVEPCIMCIAALRQAGLCRIWTAAMNDKFGGCGSVADAHTKMMRSSVPQADVRVLRGWRAVSVRLLRQFYVRENGRAPCPRRKDNRVFKEIVTTDDDDETLH